MKALLFINGELNQIPRKGDFDIIACTDGALEKLIQLNFPLHRLDFISGDFDSHCGQHHEIPTEKFIHTPDQSKTDFHKALEILQQKKAEKIHIYGASGGEMDHFLGNLTTAHCFKDTMKLTFFDENSTYYFSPKNHQINSVKGKMISLYPFPFAENVMTKGLHWNLNEENLSLTQQISTRNFAEENEVTIQFESGNLIVFLEHQEE